MSDGRDPQAGVDPARPRAGGAERAPLVLVVDDSDPKRYVATRWLRRAGFEVLEARTGQEGLGRAAGVDLVVLDVRLPDMSGFEVCRRLRAEPSTAQVPVLHLSAHATTAHERASGLDGGADGYLTQPVDEEELIATVRALLRLRRVEGALRVSEERYRLAARATSDVLWDWDLATGVLRWSDAAAGLFRRHPAGVQASAAWWFAQLHPDDRPRVVAGLRAIIDGDGEHWSDEYRLRRGDGTWATVFDRAYVAHDERGLPVRMIGSMLDVTERRRSEDALTMLAEAGSRLAGALDSEETLRRFATFLVGRAADACVVFAGPALDATEESQVVPELRPLRASAGARLRVAEAEAVEPRLSRRVQSLRLEHDSPAARAAAALVERHPGGTVRDAARADRVDGDPADAGARAILLRALGLPSALLVPLAARGHTFGVVLLGRAGQPYGDADLALALELAGRAALAVDNALHYERAVIANRAKSDFLAVMSHELRTPLNAVLGYVDLLHLGVAGSQSPEGVQYLDRIKLATRHLLGLIEQILLFSRMEAGRELVHAVPADAVALAREAASLIEPLAREKSLDFVLQVTGGDAGALEVETDVDKTRQILINLLGNAVKFTARGQVRLDVAADPHAVRFVVTDTGVGIAPQHLERVFDPFWQVEQRKTRTAGGSGLGLTVSRRLARLLGGDVSATSVPGHGSRFVFTVPRARPRAPDRPAADRAERHDRPDRPERPVLADAPPPAAPGTLPPPPAPPAPADVRG
ncbi:ATP-binding protein [Roseisolibacter sp. H3M3-2]|uniref:hybrid sensor histidine kinase/response regulator n=1 Tax=Roseisolibacter sp. H3M3-2 TaxID=3031323 RepID=UPI0023DCE576|nr:ATP-binding protein [Roseisolibacter sp. H3M3-2]MDF1504460.1 ATP-binding protein [Roseisolibacter sp. H3M3-2]